MEPSKKPRLEGLAEQITKLWKRPAAGGQATKATQANAEGLAERIATLWKRPTKSPDAYLTKARAKLNEMRARLSPKK